MGKKHKIRLTKLEDRLNRYKKKLEDKKDLKPKQIQNIEKNIDSLNEQKELIRNN